MRSRVVITGLGPVSAIGNGIEAFWAALKEGKSGIGPIESFDAGGYRSKLAGEVRGLNIREHVPKSYRKATKVMARDTELAVVAAKLAATDAGLRTRGSDEDETGHPLTPGRTGCQIGAGLIAADTEELARAVVTSVDENRAFSLEKWGTEGDGQAGMNNLPPLWLLKYLPNMLACHVTIIHGLEGPSNTIMGAEASAILSIGESARVIERGDADICFTGGAESRINPLGLIRWEYAGRLADTGEHTDASRVCRPFDPSSLGGIIGESGGMLVIEDGEHARERGARIYATIEGFGAAQSPHPSFPGSPAPPDAEPKDRGLVAAIENALGDAGIGPEDIDMVVPLGLGVPELDKREMGALRAVLGERVDRLPMLTLAERIGNTMAGHGGVMTAAAAMCLYRQELPAGARETNKSENAQTLNRALVCTGSLGGQTGAIVVKR